MIDPNLIPSNDIPGKLRVPAQLVLDAKLKIASKAALMDLGDQDNLAFTYYKGLVIKTDDLLESWEWREPSYVDEIGVLPNGFTYPDNLVVDGIDYSLKTYNFFPYQQPARSFTQAVYVNSNNPNSATIFDINNPPITNDDSLKYNVANLYIASNSSNWVYNTATGTYSSYNNTVSGSNFTITGTNLDAGSNKLVSITKHGELVIDSDIADVSGLKLVKIPTASLSSFSTKATGLGAAFGVTSINDGFLYVANRIAGKILKVNKDSGVSIDFSGSIPNVRGITKYSDGFFYTCSFNGNFQGVGNNHIYKVNQLTGVTTLFKTLSSNNISRFSICAGNDGFLYLPNDNGVGITKVNISTGVETTLGSQSFTAPYGIVFASDGFLYISEYHSLGRIYKVNTTTGVSTLFTSVGSSITSITQGSDGFLYCSLLSNVAKINITTGVVTITTTTIVDNFGGITEYADGSIYVTTANTGKLLLIVPSFKAVLKTDPTGLIVKTVFLEDIQYPKFSDLALKEDKVNKGIAGGYTPLDGNNKIPLIHLNDAILGGMNWKGYYNGTVISSSPDASLNGTALPAPSSTNKGWYFISIGNYTNNSIDYKVGDWIVSNGITWDKVDNTDSVSSVFGRTGAIIAQVGDYTTALVSETTNKNYQTDLQKLYNDATSSIQTQINSKQAMLVSEVNIRTVNGNTLLGSTDLLIPVAVDATTVIKGILQLAGDLGGTAALPTTPTALHKTGNELFEGIKSAVNTGSTQIHGLSFTNNGTGGSSVISLTNNSTGNGVNLSNTGVGYAISGFNTGAGANILLTNTGAGANIIANQGATGTGLNYIGQNNGANTFTVNKLGYITAVSYIKSGGLPTEYLMADGSVSLGITIPDATTTIKGIVQLTGDLGGTATAPTTPTALHKTTDESWEGIKSSANTGSTQINGLALTNSGSGTSNSIIVTNTGAAYGIVLYNTNAGSGVAITNNNTGKGLHSSNSSSGYGIYSSNGLNGIGIYSINSSTGYSIYSDNAGSGNGIMSNQTALGTGFNYVGLNNQVITFTINKLGDVVANKYTKTGGTAVQYLMADGSVSTLTNPITGTGVAGQLSFWDGTTSQTGDNGLFWDNTNKRLGIGTTVPSEKLQVNGNILINAANGFGYVLPGFSGFYRENSTDVGIRTNSGEKIRILDTGNVGIGTPNPIVYNFGGTHTLLEVQNAGTTINSIANLTLSTGSIIANGIIGILNFNIPNVTHIDKRAGYIGMSTDPTFTAAVPRTNMSFYVNGGTGITEIIRVSYNGNIGITGITSPTANLHIGASTTAKALMRLTVGVAPTTPNDGDIWLESNTLTGLKMRVAGVTRTVTIS